MGWKSTQTITRSEAIRLITKANPQFHYYTNKELEDMLYKLNYGDDTELEYYGHNFDVVDDVNNNGVDSDGYYGPKA